MRKGKLLVVALLVALIGGGGAYWFLVLRKRPKAAPPEEKAELALTDLSVNLADKDRSHYLAVSVTIAVKGVEPEPALEKYEPAIRDAVIMVATQHTYEDLLSAQGKRKLKDDLASAVEEAMAGEQLAVEEVLFTSFLME